MWILHFLPDTLILWFCNLLLLTGVALTVAGFFVHRIPFPLLWQYQLPFKILGIALLVLGVYFRGGYGVEMAWRERVAEVEARLKAAEEQSANENTRIETKTVNRTRLIRERGEEIVKYVDREVVKYDTKFMPGGICEIPREFIKSHNDAAEVPKK
jgi:hypothetical protein